MLAETEAFSVKREKYISAVCFHCFSAFVNQKPYVCTFSPQREQLDLVLVDHEECEHLNNAEVQAITHLQHALTLL